MNKMLNFRYAELSDTGSRWYVYYYVINPSSGNLERKRIYINQCKSLSNKKRYASKLIDKINDRLEEGWNPFINAKEQKQYTPLIKALEFVQSYKNTYIRARSMVEYNHRFRLLKEWLIRNRKDKIYVFEFTEIMAIDFMNDLLMSHKLKSNTWNKYLIDYRTFFNLLQKHKFITENPFKIIDRLPVTAKEKRPFNIEEQIAYSNYVKSYDYDFYITSMYCYYCAIRPGELVELKVENINFERQVINIPPKISKNRQQRRIPVPNVFIKELSQYLEGSNPKHYLCGKGYKPSEQKIASTRIAEHFRKIADVLDFGPELFYYGLKDTCADRLIENGFSVKTIRDLFGHSDISTTDKYLKGINVYADERLRNDFPVF